MGGGSIAKNASGFGPTSSVIGLPASVDTGGPPSIPGVIPMDPSPVVRPPPPSTPSAGRPPPSGAMADVCWFGVVLLPAAHPAHSMSVAHRVPIAQQSVHRPY